MTVVHVHDCPLKNKEMVCVHHQRNLTEMVFVDCKYVNLTTNVPQRLLSAVIQVVSIRILHKDALI